jgi:hypothetical protein
MPIFQATEIPVHSLVLSWFYITSLVGPSTWLPGISILISVGGHQQTLEGKRLAQTAAAGNLETATSAQN